jgi:ribose-phosphate pyrophosphokinase
MEKTAVVAPDGGRMKNVIKYASILGCKFSAVHKDRSGNDKTEAMFVTDKEAIKDKQCILIDDLTATCGTLINAANILKEKGAGKIYACVSHCCINEKGYKKLENSCIEKLITTDTIPSKRHPKLKVLSVADLLGSAILRTHDGRSIAELFEIKKDDYE